jgi:hypothetical protein
MSVRDDDPLFSRIHALPTPAVDRHLAERVRVLALEMLEAELRRPMSAGQVVAAAAVAGGALAYFGWAIAFVLIPRL